MAKSLDRVLQPDGSYKWEEVDLIHSTKTVEPVVQPEPVVEPVKKEALEVQKIFQSDEMQCSFLDQSLLMLLPIDKDMFEPGPITEPEDFIDDSKNILREMNSIFNICDTLKLDMNTGL